MLVRLTERIESMNTKKLSSVVTLLLCVIFIVLIFPLLSYGSWTKLNLSGGSIIDMQSFPNNPDLMICGLIERGLYISHDRGLNWNQINSDKVYDIAISDNNIVYVATHKGLISSSDYGNSWDLLIDHCTRQVIVHKNELISVCP